MAVTALTKYTQGPNTDSAGRAVKGTLADGAVTITNGDNTDVSRWKIELLYAPPGSGLSTGVLAQATSNTPSANFTPDVDGCFRTRMTVWNAGGLSNIDIRNFGIPNPRGIVVPPYQMDPEPIPHTTKPDELNFSGQPYGWSGEGLTGLLETFFHTYANMVTKAVSVTPFAAQAEEADVYLINTTTIGAPSSFTLPSAAQIGQVFTVKDNENNAYTYNITVNLPGGHTFSDGSSSKVIWASGGVLTLLRIGTTSWRVLQNTCREEFIPIVGTAFSTSLTGYQRAANANLNPSKYPASAVYVLEMLLETTNVGISAQARLWNVTAGTPVTTLSSISLTPELRTAVLATPTDLPNSEQTYEAQVKMSSGTVPDMVSMTGARIRVVYALTAG